jgi:hypothetical protein
MTWARTPLLQIALLLLWTTSISSDTGSAHADKLHVRGRALHETHGGGGDGDGGPAVREPGTNSAENHSHHNQQSHGDGTSTNGQHGHKDQHEEHNQTGHDSGHDGGAQHHSEHHDPCNAEHHADDGLAWWPFLLCCLVATVVVSGLLNKLSHGAVLGKSLNLPFTVVMFFFGYIVASSCRVDHDHTGLAKIVADSVLAWKGAHPHIILFVLLPPLLFEDASAMDYYVFRKVLMSSVILAGPGVAVSMVLTAIASVRAATCRGCC